MLLKTMLYTTAIAATALPALATPAVHGAVVPDAPSSAVHPEKWPEVAYPHVLHASGEAHVRALPALMSVAQKVGPIIPAHISNAPPHAVRDYPLGAVLTAGHMGHRGDTDDGK